MCLSRGHSSSAPYTRLLSCCAAAAMFFTQAGCSTLHFRESADREAYAILNEKAPMVLNMDPEFTIEKTGFPELDGLPIVTETDPALGDSAEAELGARIISIEKALELAVRYNRTYLNQKESLYLSALRLSLDRHLFTPIFSGRVGGDYNRSTTDRLLVSPLGQLAAGAPEIIRSVDSLAGTPGDLINAYATLVSESVAEGQTRTEIMNERSVSGQTSIGTNWLLKGGGRIAVDLTSNFLRFLTGDPNVSTSSALIGSFSQPLLRGAGRKIAAESLTQAERNVLYAIRDFTRFRKTFTVSIVSQYYNTLLQRDILRNNYLNYIAFRESAERTRAFVEYGLKGQTELGRVEQEELSASNNLIRSIRSYQGSLDSFKIQLGLPVDINLVLDEKDLEALKEQGIREWVIPTEDAVKVALFSRLDLYNARDELEDAARQVEIAANSLKPGLDLVLTGNVDSKPGDRFQELDFQRARWSAGLNLDLPLNRKSERNNYRAALIDLERADRALEIAVDNIKLEVRNAARSLDEAGVTYDIQRVGVDINESRVEEQTIREETGLLGDVQDLVDAQNDLTTARNDLAEALIRHTVARLEFWRDMGILFIKEDGQWTEITEEELPAPPEDAESADVVETLKTAKS